MLSRLELTRCFVFVLLFHLFSVSVRYRCPPPKNTETEPNRCENCRYMAPTLFQLEESYKDKVNFVMVNGDDPNNWPLIEALGVDAIPHLALVESDGTVDTALIGTVPKEWISRDIDVLLSNANGPSGETTKQSLPYQMLDVFANRPEARKIVDLDSVVEAAKR